MSSQAPSFWSMPGSFLVVIARWRAGALVTAAPSHSFGKLSVCVWQAGWQGDALWQPGSSSLFVGHMISPLLFPSFLLLPPSFPRSCALPRAVGGQLSLTLSLPAALCFLAPKLDGSPETEVEWESVWMRVWMCVFIFQWAGRLVSHPPFPTKGSSGPLGQMGHCPNATSADPEPV